MDDFLQSLGFERKNEIIKPLPKEEIIIIKKIAKPVKQKKVNKEKEEKKEERRKREAENSKRKKERKEHRATRKIVPGYSAIYKNIEGLYKWCVSSKKEKIQNYGKDEGFIMIGSTKVNDKAVVKMIFRNYTKKHKVGENLYKFSEDFIKKMLSYKK